MGPLYGRLFGQDLSTYFPHLAVSFVVWSFIASLLNESCAAFTSAESLIKQVRMPLTVHVIRLVWKNIIVFLHHCLILVIVFAFYPPPANWSLFSVPVAVVAIGINAIWVGLLLGMLCARFRDIPQLVQSVVQVMFFLTPVLWRPEALGRYAWAAHHNPLNHLLEIVRAPLLGNGFPGSSWFAIILMTLLGYALAVMVFSRYRARIAYWV
jgi:ABC-type polysaccharide/polyol phosphate export permease